MPIPYARQDISAADQAAVQDALAADFLTTGPRVPAFESAFAQYVHAPYATAVSSGTAALHLCTLALGLEPGQKVLVPSFTFFASVNCIRYQGAIPVFVDIDPHTGLLDLDLVSRMLKEDQYAGIVAVDYAGYPIDMERLRKLADAHGCWIIEDSCHAPGAFFTNEAGTKHYCGSGQYADLAIFSFHPTKHITTGEGGMITTAREDLHQILQRLRTHGITKDPDMLTQQPGGWYYEIHETGYNYRLTDFQAALGISQLTRAAAGLARRRALAARYEKGFAESKVCTMIPPHDGGHAYHLYVIHIPDRKGLYDALREQEIYTQVHYVPAHLMPIMQKKGWELGSLPHTESFYAHCLSLPMYATLTDAEQDFVIDEVRKFVGS